jgi:hypothetical protein
MSRRPAVVTQADVARTIRAALQAGAHAVDVRPDGTITIRLRDDGRESSPLSTPEPPEKKRTLVF